MEPSEASPDLKPTDASVWKKSSEAHPVQLPSGNVALVKRKPMPALLKGGFIPNGLRPLVMKAMGGDKDFDMQSAIANDPAKIDEMLEMIDLIVIECVEQPKVYAVSDDSSRDESLLYIDDVDFEDKNAVFSYVIGGTAQLEKFLSEQEADVGSVSSGQAVGTETITAASHL